MPVFCAKFCHFAALSLSTPADRMKVQWGPLVKETAERISRTIGHRPAAARIGAH
jgi:DNA-binding IclR family transcriptional regulator